jgi:hypothetical protein
MKKILAVLVVVLWPCASNAQIAEPVGVQHGTRIRLTSVAEQPVVGAFARATSDTVHLLDKDGRLHSIPASRITALHVSAGRPVQSSRVLKGVLLGTGIVAGAGAAAIAGSGDKSGDVGFAWMGLAVLAPLAGVVGGFWAARSAPEVWQSQPIASLSATPSRVAVGATPPPLIRPAKGSGRKIGVGALIGGVAGAAFAASQKSSSPAPTKILIGVVPGILLGGAIGAMIH